MRFFLCCAFCATAVLLAGCGDSSILAKSGKAAALGGRQEVVLRLAHATEDAGDLPGAEKLFIQITEQNPDASVPRTELAEFYKRHHEDQKAIDSLQAALKIAPGDADIERSLANTYIHAAEPDQALGILDSAIATHGNDPLLYNSRGVALDQTGNYAEAQKSYKKAFMLNPADGTMYKINLSMSYILQGAYGEAIDLLRPMLDAPDSPAIVRQNLALAYGLKGDNESALKLGLQDLSTREAEENVRFYRMLALKHDTDKQSTSGTGTVPASVVNALFPTQDTADIKAPAIPPDVHDTAEKAAEKNTDTESVEETEPPALTPSAAAPDDAALPEPVLRPDHL